MRSLAAHARVAEGGALGVNLLDLMRRLPARLGDTKFWLVQAMVLATTAFHYGLEVSETGVAFSILHHIPVTFYLVAVVYASVHFRLEGGILTALWAVVLTVPSMAILHQESLMWLGEAAQLVVTLAVGAVVAWRVELETTQRRRAEATSRRLALLHDVSTAVSQTLELERVLGDALARVAEALESDRAWISAWEETEEEPALLAQVGEPIYLSNAAGNAEALWQRASRQVQQTGKPLVLENLSATVPLIAEGKLIGALGVASHSGRGYTPDDLELLDAMANQIAVAMDNARLYRDELRTREALRQYAGQVTRAQEEERKRVARELHDDAVQNLILLCRELDFLLDAPRGKAKNSRQRLTELRGTADSTLQMIRRFSRDLRPSILDDLGLIPAIEWLTSDLARRTGVAASLEVNGQVRRLETEAELLLFRIVQEALRNAEKHSGATGVNVAVTFEDNRVALAVTDDGRGFRADRLTDGVYSGRLGLLGMEERAKLLGGLFEIHSVPGEGTRVKVAAPV